MNNSKYVTQNDRYKYLIDLIRFNAFFFLNLTSKESLEILRSYGNHIHTKVGVVLLKPTNSGFSCTCYINDNLNRRAAKDLNREFPTPPRDILVQVAENVILPEARLGMKRSGMKIKTIRMKYLRRIYRSLMSDLSILSAAIFEKTGKVVPVESMQISVGKLEICWDVVTAFEDQIALDYSFQRVFQEMVTTRNSRKYLSYNCHQPAKFSSADETVNDVEPDYHSGRFVTDGSKIKIYTKIITKKHTINRIERVLDEYEQFLKICGSSVFRTLADLKMIVSKIAADSFSKVYNMFSESLNRSSGEQERYKLRLLESRLTMLTPRWARTILSCIDKKGKIATGKKSRVPRPAVRVVAGLRAKKEIFRKGERSGYAYVDWNQLLQKPPQ